MLAPSVREAVELFAERVRQTFGRAVRQIVLFGSHARGEVHTDSDVDVAVVIDDSARERLIARDIDREGIAQ